MGTTGLLQAARHIKPRFDSLMEGAAAEVGGAARGQARVLVAR